MVAHWPRSVEYPACADRFYDIQKRKKTKQYNKQKQLKKKECRVEICSRLLALFLMKPVPIIQVQAISQGFLHVMLEVFPNSLPPSAR